MPTLRRSKSTYVAGHSASLLLAYLDRERLPLPELRARLRQLEAAPRIAVEVWWDLLAAIQAAHPVPALGIEIGRCAEPRDVGVLGYIAMYCDTAAQALARFSRFEPVLHNLAPSRIAADGENLLIRWVQRPTTLLSDEVIVAGIVAVGRRLMGGDEFLPVQVAFAHAAPADTSPYQRYFGGPVLFDSPAPWVGIPLRFASRPINTRDPYLAQLLEQQAQAMVEQLPDTDGFLQALQRQIIAVLQDGPPDLRLVAPRMGLSERSLYRQLGERGLRYKEVLSTLRFNLARNYLENPRLTLPEISLMLGFSEQSAFSRAFKEWSGRSPLNYRRAKLG